jgi:5-methylcytosine-specific restriction endonuclease McrA
LQVILREGTGMTGLPGHVLVLNQDYRALSVCSVERAVILLFLRKAEMVYAVPGRHIRTSREQHPWPSIVRLKIYANVPYKKIMLTRRNLLRRDRNRCQYCASSEKLTLDHVLPRSRGGRDTWENLVTACMPCNNRKGNRTPEEAGMRLIRQPFRPSHVMFIRHIIGTLDDTWKPYLFLS